MNDEHRPDDTDEEELDDDAEAEEEEQDDVEEGGLPEDFNPPVLVEGAEDIAQAAQYTVSNIVLPTAPTENPPNSRLKFRITINIPGFQFNTSVAGRHSFDQVAATKWALNNILDTAEEAALVYSGSPRIDHELSNLALERYHTSVIGSVADSSFAIGGSNDFLQFGTNYVDVNLIVMWDRNLDGTFRFTLPVNGLTLRGTVPNPILGQGRVASVVEFPSPSALTFSALTTYKLAEISFTLVTRSIISANATFTISMESDVAISTPTISDTSTASAAVGVYAVVGSQSFRSYDSRFYTRLSLTSIVLSDTSRRRFTITGTGPSGGTGNIFARIVDSNVYRVNSSGVSQRNFPAFAFASDTVNSIIGFTAPGIPYAIPPTATWSDYPASTLTTSNAEFDLKLTFSEEITGFAIGDLTTLNCTARGISINRARTEVIVTLAIPSSGARNATVTLEADSIASRVGGTSGPASDITSNNIPYNIPAAPVATAPTAIWSGHPAGTVTGGTFDMTLTFNESVTGLTSSDFSITPSTASISVSGIGTTYTIRVTPPSSGSGNINITLNTSSVLGSTSNLRGPTTATSTGNICGRGGSRTA